MTQSPVHDLPSPSILDMLGHSYGVMSFHVGRLLGQVERPWRDLVQFTEMHEIAPVIAHEFAFEEMADAHRMREEKRNIGKVIVRL